MKKTTNSLMIKKFEMKKGAVMKKKIFILLAVFFTGIYAKAEIICLIPKELYRDKNARLVYEDTEKHMGEEIPDHINLEIVRKLFEKRIVAFSLKCKFEGEIYNYIMASDYGIDYLTKNKLKEGDEDYFHLFLPTNKAFVFQDMIFIGDLMDNSVGLTDELLLIFYQINVEYLQKVEEELIEKGFKPVY